MSDLSDLSDHSYSVRQIADRMHLSEGTVTRLLRAGTIRGTQTGPAGTWRVSRTEFTRWSESLYSGDDQHRD
jgi:excisionase family DNA binding protein